MDAAAKNCEIHELPSARGCTYVIPAADFAIGLRAGAGFSTDAEMKTAKKLGVTEEEVARLCTAVVDALSSKGPMGPDEIREATGNASRNLGQEGIKKGMATTLPLALGYLQTAGEIRRIPINGRLDQQRYQYTVWKKNPLKACKLSQDEVYVELARRYFRWIGPATIAEFQWFSGLGVKAAKAAVEPLGLAAFDENRWMFADDLDSLRSHKIPKAACYKLTSSLDAMTLLRRDHKSLTEGVDLDGFGKLGGLSDLPHHAIYDRGRLVGLWEFDTATQTIAWTSFIKKNKDLQAAVAEAEAFVRDQLGDARAFSLDSPKSREPRIKALREAK